MWNPKKVIFDFEIKTEILWKCVVLPNINEKLKFKIKDHRISTTTEFLGPKLKLFRKKNLEQIYSTRIVTVRISPVVQFGYGHLMQNLI